jgi:hypothetical protein
VSERGGFNGALPAAGRAATGVSREDKDAGARAVAAYKSILQAVLDKRPSGTRLKLAAALGKNRSFISQITSPGYSIPIPARHLEVIFELCHLVEAERAEFLAAYRAAHPRYILGESSRPRTRTLILTVPDRGSARKNAALDVAIRDVAVRLARLFEEMEPP